jgi:DNA-binding HxlR family transcriptional regulator
MLDHVTSRWGVRVLMGLQDGARRFNELRRLIGGISDKMLAQTLQVLEEDGLVDRSVSPHSPPRVEYALSPMGQELAMHLRTLTDWIDANIGRVQVEREKRMRVQPPR